MQERLGRTPDGRRSIRTTQIQSFRSNPWATFVGIFNRDNLDLTQGLRRLSFRQPV
jgi:hypothetical protein